ncbi:hypothetical protein [Nocardia sp. NPDC002869]|uniref:pPIWI_RE_Y domain-containing protein n=1 Tax=Nocardia sp. NPDC002869 TaxID=3161032 RepID=UPI00398D56E7
MKTDLGLVHTIATAVIRLADATGPAALSVPYDDEAVRALNGTVLSCLRIGAEPPSGLPDLLRWCRTRPLEDWPLDLPEDVFGPDDRLIDPDSGEPTQLCHEWWIEGRDSAAATFDRSIIRTAMKRCHDASSPECYTAFRRLLVTTPVLTTDLEHELATDHFLDPVRDLLTLAYTSVPPGYSHRGKFATCCRCRILLTPTTDCGWWCERDQCRSRGPAIVGRLLSTEDTGPLLHLVRPLRHFVTGPGLAEIELEQRLTAARGGLRIEMWPGYDAYDLRITFPDGHVWAVDVKDWAHPGLLGRAARPVPPEPPYDEAFWVVPQFRVEMRREYLDIFARNRPSAARNLTLVTDRALVAAARARLRDGASRPKGATDA